MIVILMPSEQWLCYIMARTIYVWMR